MKRAPHRAVYFCAPLICLMSLSGCGNNDHEATPPAPVISFSSAMNKVAAGSTLPLVWNVQSAETCTASGGASSGWSGSVPTTGYLLVDAPSTPGTYTYTLTCSNAGQTSADSVSVQVTPANAGNDAVTLSLTPSLQTIDTHTAGSPLQWIATNAVQCTASGTDAAWSGSRATSGSFTPTLANEGVYVYNLACTSASGDEASASAVVEVTQSGPEVTLAFDHGRISEGGTSTLRWTVRDASSCVASGEDPGWVATTPSVNGGSYVASSLTAGGYIYTLSCTDAHGNTGRASTSLSVSNVAPPSIDSFIIDGTDPVTVYWTAAGATDCTAYSPNVPAWNGSKVVSGTEEIALTGITLGANEDYVYMLVCNGAGGQSWATSTVSDTDSATPAVTLIATASRVAQGAPVTLSWNGEGVSTCSASGGSGADGWSGSRSTLGGERLNAASVAGIYPYTLSCVDATLAQRAEATVYVTVGNAAPSVNLTLNNAKTATAAAGTPLNLSWNASNALNCIAEGGVPGRPWSGAQPLQSDGFFVDSTGLTGHYDFTLRCGMPGGQSAVETVGADISGGEDQCGVGAASMLLTGGDVEIPWVRTSSVAVKLRSSVGDTPIGIISAGDGSEIIDADLESYTQALIALDLLGIGNIVVDVYSTAQNTDGSIKPLPVKLGQQAGFIVSNPNQWLSLSLLGLDSMTPITGVDADGNVTLGSADYTNADGLLLTALQLVNDSQRFFVSFPLDDATTTAGVYGVRYKMKGGLLAVAKMLNFYGACITNE
ncbi:hypothetical protein E4T66_21095 [Sinimarinibacterium sp. CAU 1509]|uniref:hypothetical protein n=1 Tax=Sinimarinibacterium sp. CAU 1509 TaxID=2562283 RepID=UPI0010AD12CB|nr:hypothetical protein [Sinimarinibacterium sp. CAU 1509]TJY55170.1 hypothetical protein E4T66_21095 [Sinimarinibacterium sp. CAU 1509]